MSNDEYATVLVAVGLDYDTESPWVHTGDEETLRFNNEDVSGWFLRPVPATLADRFEQVKRDLDAVIQAIHDAAGFDPAEGRLRQVCDHYEGDFITVNGRDFWDECSTCGWRPEAHSAPPGIEFEPLPQPGVCEVDLLEHDPTVTP